MSEQKTVYLQGRELVVNPKELAAMQILETKLASVAADVTEMKQDLKLVTAGMERVIRLEEGRNQHEQALARAFSTINTHEARLSTLENEAPITKMIRGWVITAVIGVVAMFGMQVYSTTVLIADATTKPVVRSGK